MIVSGGTTTVSCLWRYGDIHQFACIGKYPKSCFGSQNILSYPKDDQYIPGYTQDGQQCQFPHLKRKLNYQVYHRWRADGRPKAIAVICQTQQPINEAGTRLPLHVSKYVRVCRIYCAYRETLAANTTLHVYRGAKPF